MKYAVLALALIPCAVLGQEKGEVGEAEKLFRKLEARLAKAETIQLKYKAALEFENAKPGDQDKNPKVEGLLLLQKGNKLRLRIDGRVLPLHDPGKAVVISDGKAMWADLPGPLRLDGKCVKPEKAPANLHSAFVASLSREGILMFVMSHVAGGTLAENLRDDLDRKQTTPTGFKMRDPEKIGDTLTQVIEFRIKLREKDHEVPVTLWLDAKTGLPVKRVLAGALSETYHDFTLDGVIDAGQFRSGEK
jgi:outer membrane lipoprotein-sorting protein